MQDKSYDSKLEQIDEGNTYSNRKAKPSSASMNKHLASANASTTYTQQQRSQNTFAFKQSLPSTGYGGEADTYSHS